MRFPYRTALAPWRWPRVIAERLTGPVPPGLWLANVLFQRVLRINSGVPFMVHFTSYVSGRVTIGRNVWVSFAVSCGCYVQGGNGVEIGDDTIFAPGVKIVSANHDRQNLQTWSPSEPIRIGRACWLGANVVILPGVQLGDGCTVAAGAVVTKSFPAGSTIGGVPAKLLSTSRPTN